MGRRGSAVFTRWPPASARRCGVVLAVAGLSLAFASAPALADKRLAHAGLATASKKSTKKRTVTDTVPPTIKLGPSIDVKKLVEATRTAALKDATRFRVSLGKPICPAGSALSAPAVQCLVTLGKTTVAYLVKPDGLGEFSAEPTFPIVAMRAVEVVAAASVGAQAKAVCGKEPFPPGSKVTCSVIDNGRTLTVTVRVTNRSGTLHAS
jgi:hypothetical protein